MLQSISNAKRAIVIALIFVTVPGIGGAGAAAVGTVDALVAWAEKAPPAVARNGAMNWSVKTSVVDYFNPNEPQHARRSQWGLGAHGLELPTPEAGSSWVYDRTHGIAADTDYSSGGSSSIFFSAPPPSTIPSRDLSGVVSAHGLHLGMTPTQAAHVFGVSAMSVRRLDAHYSGLSVLQAGKFQCPPWPCPHYGVVVFRDGRAVYIDLGTTSP